MEITNSLFYNDWVRISEQAAKNIRLQIEVSIIAGNQEIKPLKCISRDVVMDVRNNSMDEVFVRLLFPAGEYTSRVLPYKESLEAVVTAQDTTNPDLPIREQRFRAIVLDTNNSDTVASRPETANAATSNIAGFKDVTFQLVDEASELARSSMTGGIFPMSVPFDVLMAVLDNFNKRLDMDIESGVHQINAAPPSNTSRRKHINIPQATFLTDLARVLQDKEGGIYNAGIGCYLHKQSWYVWPLYDYTRLEEVDRRFLFIIHPDGRIRGQENTYLEEEGSFTAFITGGVEILDDSEVKLLSEGNGTRFADADGFMEGFVEVKGNQAIAKRTLNTNEYTGISRAETINYNPASRKKITSNTYAEASRLSARDGVFIRLTWENSNPELIIPGMQGEVAYVIDNEHKYVQATVVYAHHYTGLPHKGLHQTAMVTVTEVIVFAERLNPLYKDYLESLAEEVAIAPIQDPTLFPGT